MIEAKLIVNFILLLVSSFFSFLAIAGFVEAALLVFRIKNFRLRTLFCMLPIVKLPFDVLLFVLFGQSVLKNASPFTCDKFLQYHLSQYVSTHWLGVIFFSVIALSLWMTVRKIVQFYSATKQLVTICKSGCIRQLPVVTDVLQKSLQENGAIIVETDQLSVPCAFGRRYIIIPKTLLQTLSTDEYEAVLAHELEHLRQYDPFIKTFALLISQLFWWVPTKWWLKRLEDTQEQACDISIKRYGVDTASLARAIFKVLGNVKTSQMALVLHFASPCRSPLCRVQMLLNDTTYPVQNRFFLFLASIGCVASALFFSVWIC